MFRNLFGGSAPRSSAHELGKQLFVQGMQAASEYRTAEAIDLYTKSFEASPNPSPLINRAKLYRWRLLFDEAISDLELALRLDKQQGDEFSLPLGKELRECKSLASNRHNGQREKLVADLKENGFTYVAGRIADTVFKGDGQLLGYHLVNEVDSIKKFENIDDFPSVKLLVMNWMRDQSVIDESLDDAELLDEYEEPRLVFEGFMAVYDYPDMAKLRDEIVRLIWCTVTPPNGIQPMWEAMLRNS